MHLLLDHLRLHSFAGGAIDVNRAAPSEADSCVELLGAGALPQREPGDELADRRVCRRHGLDAVSGLSVSQADDTRRAPNHLVRPNAASAPAAALLGERVRNS